jgi:hypothetical protein
MAATARYPVGENIFNENWDICIILDACRVDALRAVQPEYEFLETVGSKISLGSSSKEWMVNTFREEQRAEIEKTTYLTGNGWAGEVLSDDPKLAKWTITEGAISENNRLVEKFLHRSTVTEEDFDNVLYQPLRNINGIDGFSAEELTDMAIAEGRESDCDRLLVHYMQPHEPYLHRVAAGDDPTEIDKRPIECLRQGCNRDEVWSAYLNNLRYVLDHVRILLKNTEGDVVITADHGEMFGRLLSGHGEGVPHPQLRRVPWVETMATDNNTRVSEIDHSVDDSHSVDDRLEALGYI